MVEVLKANSKINSFYKLMSPPRSQFKDAWSRLARNKGAMVSMVTDAIFFIEAVIVLSFTLLGNGLRNAFDPRLQEIQYSMRCGIKSFC